MYDKSKLDASGILNLFFCKWFPSKDISIQINITSKFKNLFAQSAKGYLVT